MVTGGPLPHEWSGFADLATISITGDGAAMGTMPAAWGWLPHLQHLQLSSMAFTDGARAAFARLASSVDLTRPGVGTST